MTHVLLGGRGVLGTGFRDVLRGADVVRLSPDWSRPDRLLVQVRDALLPLLSAGPTTVVWAAGVGSIAASREAMRAETEGLAGVDAAVRALPRDARDSVSVVLASSAGALYGGHGRELVQEGTPPSPATSYARVKLEQEALLRRLCDHTGCRVVACRISNLYGLADGWLRARGLVGTAVRATRLRQPMTVFVREDTRRDYVFSRDAAALCLHAVRTAPPGFSVELVCDGSTRTITDVLQLVGRVAGRRVPAVYAERAETRLQPPVLRFSPPPASRTAVRRTPMEAAVHLMLRAPLAA